MLTRFLDELFSGKPPDSFILIWTLADKRSAFFKDVESAVEYVKSLGKQDVYVGAGLSPVDYGASHRGAAKDVCGISALWIDIDIQDKVHKKQNLPSTVDEAIDLLNEPGLSPTCIVHTGHGIQAWWMFNECWEFDGEDERTRARELSNRWNNTLRYYGETHGWDVDATHDLSRVMRIPGTYNCKHGVVPVEFLTYDFSKRYNPSDFEDFLMGEPVDISDGAEVGDLYLDPHAWPPNEKWELLKDLNPKAEKSFYHKRDDMVGQTASSYDFSLGVMAAEAGWSDQEIVDLLIAHRARNGEQLKLRQSYYKKTLSEVRKAAKPPPPPLKVASDMTPAERVSQLDWLSDRLDFKINKLVKYPGDEPTYRLDTEFGSIDMGDVDSLITARIFRKKIAAVSGKLIDQYKPKEWDEYAKHLLSACETEDLGVDSTGADKARGWLEAYISDKKVTDNIQEALTQNRPFEKAGAISIFRQEFYRWLKHYLLERMEDKRIAMALNAAGCVPDREWLVIDGSRTSRPVWRLPSEVRVL